MPAGDAQRVWFPEMIEELKCRWSRTMTWDEVAVLCAHMAEKRQQIRQERGVQPPRTRCAQCGSVSRSDISGIWIRSALFALKNSGVITDSELRQLDKSWMKHKKKNGFDAFGRRAETPTASGRGTGDDSRCLGGELPHG